jgi:hypothetical protein
MGISAISISPASDLRSGVLGDWREGRGPGVDAAGLTRGAKASSQVPCVRSTSVSSRVCRVEAWRRVRDWRCGEVVRALEMWRVERWGKKRAR